jgi:hypothetical protein
MNKKLIPIIMTIFLLVMSCSVFESDTSITSSNFPLKERWSSKFDGTVYKLGVADDWIVVGQSKSITAINTESGKAMWTMDITLDTDSLLLISDDSLIAASSSQLFVINKAGEKVHTINLRPSQSTEVVAMYEDFIFVFRRAGGVLEAYSIQNETLAWKVTTHRGGVSVNFEPSTNTVFITSSISVSANNLADGSEIWKIQTVARTGVLDSDVLFYYWEAPRITSHISAINAGNSIQIWDIETPYNLQDSVFDLSIFDNKLIETTDLGVAAIDKKDGNKLWQLKLTDFVYSKPMFISNVIYTRGITASKIYAISIDNGRYLGSLNLGDPPLLSFSHRDYDLVYKSGEFLIFPYNDTVYAYQQ